jgi:hypothetical protein
MIQLLVSQLDQYIIEGSKVGIDFLRFLFAAAIIGLCVWSLVSPMIAAINRAKQMHRIPCTKCRFFTNDYRLKCTVKPHIANTEEAISCYDYQGES